MSCKFSYVRLLMILRAVIVQDAYPIRNHHVMQKLVTTSKVTATKSMRFRTFVFDPCGCFFFLPINLIEPHIHINTPAIFWLVEFHRHSSFSLFTFAGILSSTRLISRSVSEINAFDVPSTDLDRIPDLYGELTRLRRFQDKTQLIFVNDSNVLTFRGSLQLAS